MTALVLAELIRTWARQYGIIVSQVALDDLAHRIKGRYGK